MRRMCQRHGCATPLDGMRASALYCSHACKSAAYKARRDAAAQGRSDTPRKRVGGLQASAPGMVRVLVREGTHPTDAVRLVRQAMSERQRAQLEARP